MPLNAEDCCRQSNHAQMRGAHAIDELCDVALHTVLK